MRIRRTFTASVLAAALALTGGVACSGGDDDIDTDTGATTAPTGGATGGATAPTGGATAAPTATGT